VGFEDLLANLSERPDRRGREFECICQWYLRSAPEYRAQVQQVWLWDEWPGRWAPDAGIDLVAETVTGEIWAIQAKAYDPAYTIKKSDVDSFLSESARPAFAYRLLIATTDLIGPNARRTLAGQEKPAGLLLRSQLAIAEVDWPESPADLAPRRPVPRRPFPYQQEAVDAVVKGFSTVGRGQLLMASGTGKTLTACFVASALSAQRVLILVPSLSLLAQTLREWALTLEFDYLAVCSDETVIGSDLDSLVASTSEVGFPVTTDPQVIARFLSRDGERPRVVFATYQSSPRITDAQVIGGPTFDLVVADEAHRCAGPEAGTFATVLDASKIRAEKRLFMTATPRFFTGRVQREAHALDWEVASMDDTRRFGPVLHQLPFGEAIARGLLSDYQVAIIGVSDSTYRDYAERGVFVTFDGKTLTDARTLASQIGLLRAMATYDLRRVVSFHSRIRSASHFARSLIDVYEWVPDDRRPSGRLWSAHVSGEMTSGQRDNRLNRLRAVAAGERGVLTNARCLAEGVDVPTLDGVAFVEPRRSQIDILQAVGRAIRKAPDKSLGTIVIPVFIDEHVDPEDALEASEFKRVWDVVKALRAHDEVLAEELDDLRRALGRRGTTVRRPSKIVLDVPVSIGDSFARAFDSRLVVQTAHQWEASFALLREYAAREGHARPVLSHIENGYKLGAWVQRQRRRYAEGTLTAERTARLHSLPGWAWASQHSRWEERFASLRRFVARERHARVPAEYVDENGFRLGRWVREQRDVLVKHPERLSNGRRSRLEATTGWSWTTRSAPRKSWEESFATLLQYVAREGHARVPPKHVEQGQQLGLWVVAQRSAYRDRLPRLTPDRAARLEALPGWVWATSEKRISTRDWKESFSNLLQYVAREGHARVPASHVENDQNLGSWVAAQRTAYRNRSARMTPERAARLEALPGWVWGPGPGRRSVDTRGWEERFANLLQYVAREGHARVPTSHVEDDQNLGLWVNSQRMAYRNRSARMTPERASRLEALPGWVWSPKTRDDPGWEEHFRCLQRFVAREGHARLPGSHVEGEFKLGVWVSNQRADHRRGANWMTPERVARLEALPGWSWNVRTDAWENGFSRLLAFVESEGHARVPRKHVDAHSYRLGQWVFEQRRLRRRGKLPDKRGSRLEALPGWCWDARERSPRQTLTSFAKEARTSETRDFARRG
jgi:superfamily II DNA or RNA helicase